MGDDGSENVAKNEFGSFPTLSRQLEPVNLSIVGNVPWNEFLRTSSRFKKDQKFVDVRSSSFAHALYKTLPMEIIRRSSALDVKEMY